MLQLALLLIRTRGVIAKFQMKNDCQIVRTEGVHHFDLEFMQRSLKIFAFDYFWPKRIKGEQKSKNVMVRGKRIHIGATDESLLHRG